MRFMKHGINANYPQHSVLGLRVDQGFSSFMTFYLQYNYVDFAVSPFGAVRRHPSIGAGVQFMAGKCRVPGLSRLSGCSRYGPP